MQTCELGTVPDLGAATCRNMVRWPVKGDFGGSSDVLAIRCEWHRGAVHGRVLPLASIAASIVRACDYAVVSRVRKTGVLAMNCGMCDEWHTGTNLHAKSKHPDGLGVIGS